MRSFLKSPEELDRLSNMDPDFAVLQQRVIPEDLQPTPDKNPSELIKRMRAMIAMMPVPPPVPEVMESQSTYTTRDGTSLKLHVFKPANSQKARLPVVVYYHGGGHCIGTPQQSAVFSRRIVMEQDCVVVAPQYRLAPESKFPTQVEDSWDALKHIATHAQDFGADATAGFVIGGESAGAVITSVLALQARDEPLQPPVIGVFLSAGSYFNPNDISTHYKTLYRSRTASACTSAPMLSQEMKALFDRCLQGDYASPYFKASLCPFGHARLAKTYLQTCGMDMNRDESFLYADVLQKAGVEVKMDEYAGAPHCF